MAETTKITLSAGELELVCNSEWLLTKQAIISKVYRLFGNTADSMQNMVNKSKQDLPDVVLNSSPKISKGENYRLLPYVMLDYPRYFDKHDTLAIRGFFWWGNFFSITLQLAGKYKTALIPGLCKNFSFLQENNYWVCCNNDPWQHHFENDNYSRLKNVSEEEFAAMLNSESFVKIAKKIPLTEWLSAQGFLEKVFGEMLQLIKHQAPSL